MAYAVRITLLDDKGKAADRFIVGPFDNEAKADEWVTLNYAEVDDSPDYQIDIDPFFAPSKKARRL